MNNFVFQNPTKIIFGKDTHLEVGKEIKPYADKILFVRLAKASMERIGIYDSIIKSLEEHGIEYIELDGIQPNPRLSKVREGAEICKRENISFILAVGGGSVVDTAKAIAAAACMDNDYWDIVEGKVKHEKSIPLGTIITYPATGTEMNGSCVITRDEDLAKRGFILANPTFSILNPEIAKSLPKNRIAQGVVDIFAHAVERYFTNVSSVDLTDRMLEGTMKTVIRFGSKWYHDGYDYDTVAQVMWSATIAHNFSLCVGRVNDFASHQIGHELSGEYDLSHGESLSVIMPSWMRYVRHHDPARMAQFFVNTFHIENNFFDPQDTITRGICAMEAFFQSLDMPIRISQTDIADCDIQKLANRATQNGKITRGNFVVLQTEDLVRIYENAM